MSLDTFNLDYANKLLKIIVTKINQLNEFPYIGPLLSIKIKVKTNYRYLICNKYIIFYKVDNKQIFVVRILHSRMDYAQVIFGEKQENKVTS